MNYKELTISQKEKILEMLKNGYSNTYIAKKIKVTPYKVSILRLIYNIKTYRAIHQVALTGPAECIRCSKRNCLGCPYYLFEEADKKWKEEKNEKNK